MTDTEKARQLNRHKWLATGLFLLMMVVYVLMAWLLKTHPANWQGYVKAAAEAAMVGALADWFAVTALFHYPLGLHIPHTNLIENSKQRIGDNLGNFVVSNFLTAGTIRPYLEKLQISPYAARWLSRDKNQRLLITEATRLLNDIVQRMNSKAMARFLARKGAELLDQVPLHTFSANALESFLRSGGHQPLITLLAQKIKAYIGDNQSMVRDRVKSESYFFIPKFIDNKLAEKITTGLAAYMEEIELDQHHRVRTEITEQLYQLASRMRTEPAWQEKFHNMRNTLLPQAKLEEYAANAWEAVKATLQQELSREASPIAAYILKTLKELAQRLDTDKVLQEKIDGWIRFNAYKYTLRNTQQVGALISNTIGNWQGKELSRKLELEVGKDLQFIRINGTVVGGLVGLLIYTITEWLG